MLRKFFVGLVLILLLATSVIFSHAINAQVLSKRVIVTFRQDASQNIQDKIIESFRVERVKRLSFINSQVLKLTSSQITALSKNSQVLRVEEDAQAFALCHRWWHRCNTPTPTKGPSPTPSSTPTPTPPALSQSIPWGVDRVDADNVWAATTADSIKVAVVDTGIDLDHPDLTDNIKGGVNTIQSWKNADDDNGHGSHVAGIIAALNNTVGVVGMGPQIDLYAVKVLNKNGSGYVSDIIEGIDWSINNNINVINMSLGTTSDVISFHDAVIAARNAGIVVVAAAGNSGPANNTVIYPAKYPESIAVSATDSLDGQPSFSSRGPEVDLAAPGVSIYSAYKNGSYTTLSGTSMAAPHIAGAAALVLATHPGFTPSQVQSYLQANAELLGSLSSDQQGFGLVDAEKATLAP